MQQVAMMATNGTGRDRRLLEGLLATLPLFEQVARSSVVSVASHSRVHYLRRGAAICRRGERMPGVITIGYGIVKLALRRADSEEKVVRFLKPGEAFGESAALVDRPCPVDVVALEDSMIAVMPPAPLLRLIELEPRFALNLVRALGDKFLVLLEELHASIQYSSRERVAAYLDSLVDPGGAGNAAPVRLPASKTAVAARLGMTKETMSRVLRDLLDQKLITMSGREILIVDRQRLAQAAG